MTFNEFVLTEALRNLYHATYISRFRKMLEDNTIYLTIASGFNKEINKGKLYYLSTSRSKYSDYAAGGRLSKSISYPVIMNLNGQAINTNKKIKSIDYWGPAFRGIGADEQEDRIVSDDPKITPLKKYVDEVHIYIPEDDRYKNDLFQIDKLSKELDIPVYFYSKDNKNAFKTQRKDKAQDLSSLITPPEEIKKKYKKSINYTIIDLQVLIDLYKGKKQTINEWKQTYLKDLRDTYEYHLDNFKDSDIQIRWNNFDEYVNDEFDKYNKKFDKREYDLKYASNFTIKDMTRSFEADLHNLKSEHLTIVHDIAKILKKEKLNNIEELLILIKNKLNKDNKVESFKEYYFVEMPHSHVDTEIGSIDFDFEMEKPNWAKKLIKEIEIVKQKYGDKHIMKLLSPFYQLSYGKIFKKKFENLRDSEKEDLRKVLPQKFLDDMGVK